jgi:hypothetical protein
MLLCALHVIATHGIWYRIKLHYNYVENGSAGANKCKQSPLSSTTCFVTPSAVSVVICTEPR